MSCIEFHFFNFAQDKDTKEVIILQTSDVHSRIEPINQKGTNIITKVVLSAGLLFSKSSAKIIRMYCFSIAEIFQGTPYYNMFRGEVEIKLMNEMGYDAMTIGNHEFDFDVDNMARIFKMADFPVVCANYNLDATVLKDIVKPYVVLEKYGLRIGVFGLGTQPEGMIQANKCEGVVYEDPIRVSNEIATLLKEEEGCDLVVCLSHLGIQMDEHLVAGTHNIDVILGGHSYIYGRPQNILEYGRKRGACHAHRKNGVRVGRPI